MGSSTETWRGRRDGRWMMMWLFEVLAAGAYGIGLVWVAVLYVYATTDGQGLAAPVPDYLGRSVGIGIAHALLGAAWGLPVGLVLTFLVGDGTGPKARRAAVLAAAATHALGAVAIMAMMGGAGFAGLLLLVVLTAVAGVVAGRWHDRLASRPRWDDFYAH